MFTKHTSHSTVNPLDAKQTHQELPPPCAQGCWLPQHHPASRGFFGLVFFGHHPRCLHLRAPAWSLLSRGGVCFCPLPGSSCSPGSCGKLSRGSLLLPPPRLFPLGWQLWEVPVSAREVLARWEMLALTPCPPRCTLRPNFPYFPSLGLAQSRQGMLPWPQGVQDLPHICAGSGPLASPMWGSPLEILGMPTLP